MKISFKWLNDHIDLSDYKSRPGELAQLLTASGLEVENIEDPGEAFKHVVVGQIMKLEKHPNADRLTVCQVDAGEGSLRQIVCGAKNHKQGDKVVVTLPGAVLPGNFAIKKSKIRDVESLGMLASESELGLKKESEGIMILPPDAPVGEPFARYYGLDDVTFEINVTPNRADCLSHLGVARELATLLDRPLKTKKPEVKVSSGLSTKQTIGLEVKDEKLCSRYAGRLVRSVKVGPSPEWLKRRLETVGLNSINNVVDVTNFIMVDRGQPLHAFDLKTLAGPKIIVAPAEANEKFKTLDGTDIVLKGDELTIRDAEKAVCIAGVIGGVNSGVTEATTDLFIESAHFAMDSVRRTSRRHGLQTDSAYRFSRGTDESGVVDALEHAVSLIQQVAGGEVAADWWDLRAPVVEREPIRVSTEFVGQKLGLKVDPEDLKKWLHRLNCQVEVLEKGVFSVRPPAYRVDLEQDVDFVEEYGRLNGYNHIPENLPVVGGEPLAHDKQYLFEQRMAELARISGMLQCVNYGFLSGQYQEETLGSAEAYKAAGLDMDSKPVRIKNALSSDLDTMRVSLVPGLLKNLLHNVRHGSEFGRFFEIGQIFGHGDDGYEQKPRMGVVAWGLRRDLWTQPKSQSQIFFDLKGRVQLMLDKLLIQAVQWKEWVNPPSLLHPAQAAILVCEGRPVGYVATIHPQWSVAQKIRVPVAVGELDLVALGRGQPRSVKFKPVSKFPAVERDLALVLPKDIRAQDVAVEIKKAGGALLQSIEVFDVFEGGEIPESHRSVAYRMVFQDSAGTLTDDQMAKLHQHIVSSVSKKFPLKVR